MPAATTYYATLADARANSSIPDAAPPSDEVLADLIVAAEDLVDRLIGPAAASSTTGRKVTPAGLTAGRRELLKRATVVLTVAMYLDPGAFDLPTVGTEKGPDFERTVPLQGRELPASADIIRAAELLDRAGLRVLTARLA